MEKPIQALRLICALTLAAAAYNVFAQNSGADTDSDNPVFTDKFTWGKQAPLGGVEGYLGSKIVKAGINYKGKPDPELVKLGESRQNAASELEAARNAFTSEKEKRLAISRLQEIRSRQGLEEGRKTDELLAKISVSKVVSNEERTTRLKKAEAALEQVDQKIESMPALKASGLKVGSIKALTVIAGVVLIADVADRLHIYFSYNDPPDPTWSPLFTRTVHGTKGFYNELFGTRNTGLDESLKKTALPSADDATIALPVDETKKLGEQADPTDVTSSDYDRKKVNRAPAVLDGVERLSSTTLPSTVPVQSEVQGALKIAPHSPSDKSEAPLN